MDPAQRYRTAVRLSRSQTNPEFAPPFSRIYYLSQLSAGKEEQRPSEREAHGKPEAERYHAEDVPLSGGAEGASLVALQEVINENARHSWKLISVTQDPTSQGVFLIWDTTGLRGKRSVAAPGKGDLLLRVTLLVFVVAAAILLWRASEEPIRALETPELRPAPEVFKEAQPASANQKLRIGSFERPVDVPGYEILEETPTGSDGARGAWLLVDTRSRSQEDFTLITRDLKARYADYDVVSVEFIDSSVVLDYNGGAVIFNTPVGAERAGYIYGPPSRGYYVRAAD